MKKILNNQKGFSAIELLFVILVIGVLIFISTTFLNTSRTKARDAKRLVDVRRIQTALEFYNLEYSTYPKSEKSIVIGKEPFLQLCDASSGSFVSSSVGCSKVIIAPIPSDPKSGQDYVYIGNEDGYTIQFLTEAKTEVGPSGYYYAHSENIDQDPSIK